jgi:hypothetical protein
MNRLAIPFHAMLAGALLSAWSPDQARGDQDDDERLARRLVAAAEKYGDLREVTAKYGRRAEIALAILQKEQERADLVAAIRDMNTEIATFPQNRRWWLVEQWSYYEQKLAGDRHVNHLDRELNALRFQEKRMYEEELRKAQATRKPVKPFHREALLNELQRLDRECDESCTELKAAIEAAAREARTTPRRVIQKAVGLLPSLEAPPDVEREFLPTFTKRAGGPRWLDGEVKPPPASKARRASAQAGRAGARFEAASLR